MSGPRWRRESALASVASAADGARAASDALQEACEALEAALHEAQRVGASGRELAQWAGEDALALVDPDGISFGDLDDEDDQDDEDEEA